MKRLLLPALDGHDGEIPAMASSLGNELYRSPPLTFAEELPI